MKVPALPAPVLLIGLLVWVFGVQTGEAISSLAQRHFRTATELKDQGKYSEALQEYRKALEVEPEYPEALNNIGFIYFQLKSYDLAAQTYERALALNPDDEDLLFNLAVAYIRDNRPGRAVDPLGKILERSPKNTRALSLLAGAHIQAGDQDNAIRALLRLSEQEPEDARVYVKLGAAFFEKGDYDKAAKYYQVALIKSSGGRRRTPLPAETLASVYLHQAQIALETGDFAAGREACRKAREQVPALPESYRIEALIALAANQPEDALEPLQKALQAHPKEHKLRWELARVHTLMRGYAEAEAAYRQLLGTGHRPDREILLEIGRVQEKDGRTAEALETFDQVLAAGPSDPDLLTRVARLAVEAGKPERAAETLEELLKARPAEKVTPYLDLADIYHRQDKPDQALATLRRGRTHFPREEALYGRALAYAREAQRDEEVQRILEEQTTAFPDELSLQLELAHRYLSDGQIKKAQELFRELTQKFPDEERALYGLGLTYLEEDRYEPAVLALRRVLQADPDHAGARQSLARAESQLIKRRLESNREQVEQYMAQERYREALRLLETHLQGEPEDAWAQRARDEVKSRLREQFEAEQSRLEAAETEARVKELKAEVQSLLEAGEPLDAMVALSQLDLFLPDDPWVREIREQVQAQLNREISAELSRKADTPSPAPALGTAYRQEENAHTRTTVLTWLVAILLIALGAAIGGLFVYRAWRARSTDALTGRLEKMNIMNVVQFLNTEDKTGILTVSHGGERGKIYFVGGKIDRVRLGEKTGVEALFAMFEWVEGEFGFQSTEVRPETEIELSVQHLLLQFACQKDEEDYQRSREDDSREEKL
jgi:tetratricopeptide (TPR) repeat protein